MNTKKTVLVLGIIGSIYIGALVLLSVTRFCPNSQICTDLFMRFAPWNIANYIFFALPLLLLSLITYKMRDEVFRAWWGFARWWVPVILVVTLFLSAANGGGGLGIGGAVSAWFDAMVLGLLHVVLVVVSLTKIVRTYLKTK